MPQPRTLKDGKRTAARRKVRATTGSLSRTLEHPADRTEQRRGMFDELAQRA